VQKQSFKATTFDEKADAFNTTADTKPTQAKQL